ncbi:MAG: VOC family protein [Blastocatellia bacterium]|nr:VOC family protein [Blastocatellia bacterium]
MPPTLQHIDHIHVHVADRNAAEAWYQSVLGFTRVEQLAFWAADGGPLTLADASGTIHLALFERPAQSRHATIALAVDAENFLAWREHLRGVPDLVIELEDHDVSWSLYFHDPDGNPYEITSYDYNLLVPQLRKTNDV